MRQVIKVGGSLCVPERWPAVLRFLGGTGSGLERMIVPGGGAYADTVAEVQSRLGLSDALAHRQALLAMEQTAYLLQDGIRACFGWDWPIASSWVSSTTIWTPRAWLHDEALPHSWDLSSDSLAVILATRFNADELLLVKSLPTTPDVTDPMAWVREHWVDPLFAQYAKDFKGRLRLLGVEDWSRLGE